MSAVSEARQYRCPRCASAFTSQVRFGHHWAAEHAPRTTVDIPRTSLFMARAGQRMLRVPRPVDRPTIKTSAAPAARAA